MKDIILAKSSGTRLYLVLKSLSKQLFLIYNKSIIYHSLFTFMLVRINKKINLQIADKISIILDKMSQKRNLIRN